MSIVTKAGDDGDTGLYGGARVSKAFARLHAYGTVDELNALLGVAAAEAPSPLREELTALQHALFRLGADLATPLTATAKVARVSSERAAELERRIAELEAALPAQRWFILPGGTRIAALLHHARTICRRAERWVVALKAEEEINLQTVVYLNRLSDLLFVLARRANADAGAADVRVAYE